MKVLQVVHALDYGGLEQLVIQLAEHLQSKDIISPIVSLTNGVLMDKARRHGVETFALEKSSGFQIGTVRKLAQLIKRERIDLLHTHNFAPLVHGTLAATLTGIRTVNTRHGRAPESAHRLIWQLTDRVIAVSEDTRRELLKHNRINPRKVRVIPNGIDISPYEGSTNVDAALRRELKIEAGAKTVGTIGRLAREKDHATLLKAFRLVRDQAVDAHLVIVGGGALEGDLRRLTEDLGLSPVVHFLGFRSDVRDLLPCFDVFALSSMEEGLSLTLLEAMAAGRPVVASAVGGNPEVVVDGSTGLLVAPGNPPALAAAIVKILLDSESARTFGQAGRKRVERLFTIELFTRSHTDLYADLVAT